MEEFRGLGDEGAGFDMGWFFSQTFNRDRLEQGKRLVWGVGFVRLREVGDAGLYRESDKLSGCKRLY
jgi:hypothetical protein